MLVVMRPHATPAEIDRVVAVIHRLGLTPHPLPGATRTAVGLTGNTSAVDKAQFEVLPGVERAIRVTKAFKLASREMHPHDTVVTLPQGLSVGPGTLTVVAGPCSVETEDLTLRTAEFLMSRGVKLMRAGAFKPRTSPYAFQGLGLEGLAILSRVRAKTGIGIVTELLDTDHASAVEEAADVIQIGTRNMQNFALLKRVGLCRKPVLLKRGMSATLEDWLMAAEYVMARRQLRRAAVRAGRPHLLRPQPQHPGLGGDSAGQGGHPLARGSRSESRHRQAGVCAGDGPGGRRGGADGLLIEAHPDPDKAASDGAQTLDFDAFDALLGQLRRLAPLFGRTLNG